ncbi:unnamed protein product [Ilex paraguariensis]|uniref:DRBM domain-containing protein n=1 Tax=Ilex paraguariensis TaxID=185542 RepID=A0ABC8QQM7_9AQUA
MGDTRLPVISGNRQVFSECSSYTARGSLKILQSTDMLHLYKNRLQHYAQKKNITFPEYSCELDGPPHSRRFKSSVTIDGRTFKALAFCSTLKDAEHAAAKVAFESLSLDNFQEDDGLYKNLLQELSQKEGFLFPTYDTSKTGPPHDSTFVSTVEIGGEMFKGGEAKSKKQAEMNAAKAAYTGLTERRAIQNSNVLSPGCYILKASGVASSGVQSVVAYELQPNINPQASLIICEEQAEEEKGGASKNPKLLSPGCNVEEELKVSPSCVQSIATDDLQQNSRRKAKLVMDEEQKTEEKGVVLKTFNSVNFAGLFYC